VFGFAKHNHNRVKPKPNMILRIFIAITALLSTCIAHNIQLKAHSRECFHEFLHVDDKMTVTFQIGDREFGGSGNLEIDFWVQSCSLTWFAVTDRNTDDEGRYKIR